MHRKRWGLSLRTGKKHLRWGISGKGNKNCPFFAPRQLWFSIIMILASLNRSVKNGQLDALLSEACFRQSGNGL